MLGLRLLVNGTEIASVSNEGRNIINAYVSGDVIGPELGEAHMTGGFYDKEENTSHRIWVDHHVITQSDEIEIQFLEKVATSSRGMTIDEFAEVHENDYEPEAHNDENIFDWIARQSKFRAGFSFKFSEKENECINVETSRHAHSFHFGVMWKWTNPKQASIRLSSTTLENMKKDKAGIVHINRKMSLGQSVRLRIASQAFIST